MKAKAQAELAFPPAPPPTSEELRALGEVKYRDEIRPVLEAAIARITAKEAAYLCDVRASYLADALAGRDNKGPRLEWLVVLLVATPDAVRLELLTALCSVAGYMAPERARPKTPEEENRARRRAMSKFLAPELIALIEREVEGGSR